METAACAMGTDVLFTFTSTEPCVSLKQCGKSRRGIVSPHGPGDTKYPTDPLIVIRASLSGPVRKFVRPAVKDGKSIDVSCVESLALKTTKSLAVQVK